MATEIATRPAEALMRMDPQALIAQAITSGAGIETLERLVALAKDMQATVARQAWYDAKALFHQKCPPIFKREVAETRTYAYRYAPLDDVLAIVTPVLSEVGMSISWKTSVTATHATARCILAHALGHVEESGEMVIPIQVGADDRGANPAQRVGIARTYACRYALHDVLGIAPEDDPDAEPLPKAARSSATATESGHGQAGHGGGDGPISEPQQRRLWAIAREHVWEQGEVKDLLTSLGIETTKDIPRSKYEQVIEQLKARPRTA